MAIHYSLFKTRANNGENVILSLAHINAIIESGAHYTVHLTCCTEIDLTEYDAKALIDAWTIYQQSNGARTFIGMNGQSPTLISSALLGDQNLAEMTYRQYEDLKRLEELD